jgi:hypothetical protein
MYLDVNWNHLRYQVLTEDVYCSLFYNDYTASQPRRPQWIHLAQDLGPVMGHCKHGNEPSGPTEGGKFLDELCDY